ncbi:NAD(P)H-dependent flavin oxidoreductase [Mameliella sediminis]|uniref:NAD(P)H-dependent flavin oxidoreductase n=1 Tax=Mameliella sediminis TaxID=2836866 RepID=UPI001C43EC7A|nr:nitronate monooxygenase family protein [Mameliella sediminis]
MMLPETLKDRLSIPVIAAPMFLASGPELVIECCKAGVAAGFPALNQRSTEGFETWVKEIKTALDDYAAKTGKPAAPFGVNLVVHPSNPRLQADLEVCVRHRVPLVMSILGADPQLVDAVHGYGGLVFHDVVNAKHARKAVEAGVDGLTVVAAGAGGHAGTLNPFALINEIRQFYDGTVILGGGISSGSDVAAAQMMGADLAYVGTRFLGTQECMISDGYKQMLLESNATDIVYTPVISGVPASFLKGSLKAAGIDPRTAETPKMDLGLELAGAQEGGEKKPWKDIWSAGQGVGSITDLPQAADLIARMKDEYTKANAAQTTRAAQWS